MDLPSADSDGEMDESDDDDMEEERLVTPRTFTMADVQNLCIWEQDWCGLYFKNTGTGRIGCIGM